MKKIIKAAPTITANATQRPQSCHLLYSQYCRPFIISLSSPRISADPEETQSNKRMDTGMASKLSAFKTLSDRSTHQYLSRGSRIPMFEEALNCESGDEYDVDLAV
jgi:hypothetical protein